MDTVSFDKPPRFTTTNSLVAAFQPAVQRIQNLPIDGQVSTSYEFTAQQFIFNARDYMDKFGRSAMAEIGSKIEQDVSGLAETNTFRFYGDGVTPISSYLQLANALAYFRNFGAAKTQTKGFLSDLTFPQIVNSGLNQFTMDRGNKEAMSWEIGKFSNAEWFQSNLLKVHYAGSQGNAGVQLTVVSTALDSTGAVVSITFSGASAPSDPNCIKQYDKFVFQDGVAGLSNLRFLTFIGQSVSQSPVQFRAQASSASDSSSNVTVSIYPPLQASLSQVGNDGQYINNAILPGMKVSVLPDHRCGLIYAGDALYLGMPRLPDEVPYPTSVASDPDSAASIRMYYGSLFGQNQRGIIHDCIWGKTLVDEYAMMIALPV